MSPRTTTSHDGTRVGLGIAVVFLVLFLVVVGGFLVLHSQWFLNYAEAKLTESVGQEVTIQSFDVDIGRIIRFRVEEVSVANPPWASASSLASVDVLEAGLDLFELLTGNVVFAEVRAVAPIVHLERSPQGTPNWATGAEGGGRISASGNQPEEDNGFGMPRIESLVLKDGTLTFTDPHSNTAFELFVTNQTSESIERKDGIVAEGSGQVAGQPIKVVLSAGLGTPETPVTDLKHYPVELRLHAPETMLHVQGTVNALVVPETANLHLTLEGQNLSRWDKPFDVQFPAFPSYQLTGEFTLKEGMWAFDPMNLRAGHSEIRGTLRVLSEADPFRLEGELYSPRLDVAEIQNAMPKDQPSEPLSVRAATFAQALANMNWQAELNYRADLIEAGEQSIQNVRMALMMKDHTLTMESLSGTVAEIPVNIEANVTAKKEPAEVDLQLSFEAGQSDMAQVAEAPSKPNQTVSALKGTLTGQMAVKTTLTRTLPQEEKDVKGNVTDPANHVKLDSVAINQFQLHYAESSSRTDILARLDTGNSHSALIFETEGTYHGTPIEASVTVPGLDTLMDAFKESPSSRQFSADLKIADATASVNGTMKPVWPPTHIDLRFLAQSEAPAATAEALGLDVLPFGRIALKGSLSKRNHAWIINEFRGQFGESQLQGSAIIQTGDNIRFQAVLNSHVLNVAALIPHTGPGTERSDPAPSRVRPAQSKSTEHPLADMFPPWLQELNGKVSLDVRRLVLPETHLSDVSIDAVIDDGVVRIDPLSLPLGGGVIRSTAHLNLRSSSLSGGLQTEIQQVGLGEALETFGREAADLGEVSGRIALNLPVGSWNGEDPLSVDASMERVRIEEVRLRYDDPALQAKTDLRLMAESMNTGMQINGTVEYQDRPVDVFLSTGSLREAWQDYTSMPVHATFEANKTTIEIKGSVGTLYPIEKFHGKVRVEGPDPARLGEALGIPLPHLPPYQLQAQLHRTQGSQAKQTFNFQHLSGIIGDSDVAGTLRVTTGGERPMMLLHLRSDKLDLDDLAPLVGAPPDPEETASEKQEAQAEGSEDRETVLPAKPMDFTQLRQMDANVEYRAKRVQAPDLPLDEFMLDLVLEDGHLRMERLDFGVAGGTMAMALDIHAQELPVKAKLTTEFDQVNLSRLLARFEVADDSFGNIGGRGALWMQGESLARWFSTADGGLYLTMTGGHVDAMLVELAGLDFGESVAILLSTDQAVHIDCAYADLQARSGIVTIHPFLLDTQDTKFKGRGEINLQQERMDVTVNPYPQDFTLISSRGPLHITGTFTNPNFSVDPSFPLPEFGKADDSVRCDNMIDGLRQARKNAAKVRKTPLNPADDVGAKSQR